MKSRKIPRKPTIPPIPIMRPINIGEADTLQGLREQVNTLTTQVGMLDRELRLQREVYLQALSFLGYDIDRIRDLDRKIREANR